MGFSYSGCAQAPPERKQSEAANWLDSLLGGFGLATLVKAS
jgi:hypothetical protein